MEVLLVNQRSASLGGSESYLLTVGPHLQRLGHEVVLMASAGTAVVGLAEKRGLAVAGWDAELTDDPDIILTQDTESAYLMAGRYPGAVRIYVSHSPIFEPQRPPSVPNVCHAIVTLNDGTLNNAESLGVATEVLRLRQPVDLSRFTDRGGRGEQLRRVLLLGNHWGGPGYRNHRLVAAACDELGVELEHVGTGGRISLATELEIANADVVIGLGRCIVEAMASARAAYVFGDRGGDGWVTAGSYEALEARAFAGAGTTEALDANRIREDLAHFDADMGQVNRHLATANHSVIKHVDALVELFNRLDPKPMADPSSVETLARLSRIQRELESRTALAERDARSLRAEVERLTVEAEQLRAQLDGQRALLGMRRHRLAERLGAGLDRVRSRRGD